LNKLEKGPIRDNETAFCLLVALTVLDNKIFRKLAFSLSVVVFEKKIFKEILLDDGKNRCEKMNE
jgi:hypothetical protein